VVAKDKPKRRKQGFNQDRKKLLDLEHVANNKGKELVVIARKLGAKAFNRRIKAIDTSLKSKSGNLLKVRTMMDTFGKPDNQPNVRQKKRGKDMPPRLLGYFPYVPFGRTINMSELDKELTTRNVTFELILKVKKRCKLLKKDEVRRLEEQVDTGLASHGYVFKGLKLPQNFSS
jgi:hypothetical protein